MNWLYHKRNLEGKIHKNYHRIGEELQEFKTNVYDNFHKNMIDIDGISKEDCFNKVDLINSYYKEAEKIIEKYNITFQSKFRPTILEEFCGYLFKDIPEITDLDLNFYNKNIFAGLKIDSEGNIKIQDKDTDFCIGKEFTIEINGKSVKLIIPLIVIECKTYLDKTMFNETQFTAQKLKSGTPNVKFYIITERNEVGIESIPSQSPVDEIYVIKHNLAKIDKNIIYEFFIDIHNIIRYSTKKKEIELPGKLLKFIK